MRKIISITLIAALLINSNLPSFAQNIPYMPSDLQTAPAAPADFQDIYSSIYGAVSEEMQLKLDIREKFKNIPYAYDGGPFEEILRKIEQQIIDKQNRLAAATTENEIITALSEFYSAEVCIDTRPYYFDGRGENICAPYAYMAAGLISGWLAAPRTDEFNVIKHARRLTEPVATGLLERQDINKIRNFLWGEMRAQNGFRGYTHNLDYYLEKCNVKKSSYRDQDDCETALNAAELLVATTFDDRRQNKETADYIYNEILKKSINGRPYSSLLLPSGIGLLAALDTDYSFRLIKKFLTDYSVPSTLRNAWDNYGLGLSLQGIHDAVSDATRLGRGVQYLNAYNKRWQYIDREFSEEKLGVKYIIRTYNGTDIFDFQTHSSDKVWNEYNLAFGNLLTDIGKFLPSQGERGKRLSREILNEYNGGKYSHLPLILGLIQGLKSDESARISVNSAAHFLGDSFYVDINGGTGRYILDGVKKSLGSGTIWQNTNTLEYYRTKGNINEVLYWADSVIAIASLALLALSLPKLLSDAYRIVRIVRYGKLKTLIRVSRNINRTARTSSTQSRQAAVTRAETRANPQTATTSRPAANTRPAANPNPATSTPAPAPRPEIIQLEKPTNLTETIGGSGGGALSTDGVAAASGGGAAQGGNYQTALQKMRVDDVLIGTPKNGYYISAQRANIYDIEINAMKKAGKAAKRGYQPNNIFNKSYNQMNGVERFIINTQANGSHLWKSAKTLFSTVIHNPGRTIASAGTLGMGEAPAIEAQIASKAPIEIVTTVEQSAIKAPRVIRITQTPLNLYDPQAIPKSYSAFGKGLRGFNAAPLVRTPKLGLFPGFKVFNTDPVLIKQQKINDRRQVTTTAGFTTVAALVTAGVINPVTGIALTAAITIANAMTKSNQTDIWEIINERIFNGRGSNARSDTEDPYKRTDLTIDQVRALNILTKSPLFAVLYSFMVTGFGDFVSPAVALAQNTFNISPLMASALPLVGYLMFFLSVPISRLQSRIGKANVIKLGAAIAAAGAALPMFFGMYGHFVPTDISQFYIMAASVALVCLGTTMMETGSTAMFADVSKDNPSMTTNLVWGDAARCIPIALGFMAPAILDLLGFDWTGLYPITTAFFLAALITMSSIKIAETKPDAPATSEDIKELLKNPSIGWLVAAAFAYIGSEIPFLSMTPLLFTEQGFTTEQAETMAFLTTMLPIIISNFISPPLIRRFGEDKVLITSLAAALAGFGLVMTPGEITTYIGLVVAGLGYGNIFPMLIARAQQKDVDKVDIITGLMITSTAGGAFMTPAAAALAQTINISLSYLIPTACVMFILGVILRDIYRTPAPPNNNETNGENTQQSAGGNPQNTVNNNTSAPANPQE